MKKLFIFGAWICTLCVALAVSAQEPGGAMKDRFGGKHERPGPGFDEQGGPQGGPHGGKGGGDMGGMMAKIVTTDAFAEKLGLSAEQSKQIKDGIFELRKKEIQLKADQEIAGEEQARLMTDESSSDDAILGAIEKAGKIRTELAKVKAKQLLLIRKILTQEQRKQLRKLIREHMEKAAEGGGAREKMQDRREGMPDKDRGEWRERGQGWRDGAKKDRWGGGFKPQPPPPPAAGEEAVAPPADEAPAPVPGN